jgi:hypothetical protein
MIDDNGKEYLICVVGNIIGPHIWGEEKRIQQGTKHFRPGAKVYCIFMYGGDGNEHIRVLGKPRKSGRMIDVVIRTGFIKNFRLQKTYEPRVINFITKYPEGYSMAEESLKFYNASNAEIKMDRGNQSPLQ